MSNSFGKASVGFGSDPKGLIFDVQGYSVHDGSGCRTLVFMSGCPLRCTWCSNPEGQLLRPRLMYREQRCKPTQYRCVRACPRHAISVAKDGTLNFDRSLCDACETMECRPACLNEALCVAGREYSVGDLMRILRRDQGFWGAGGGVTLTGGEPLTQREFTTALLQECRASYMHTTVETCAQIDPDSFLSALQWVDWLFVDIKHMDSAVHRAQTGAGNELILRNVRAVASSGWNGRLVVRVPIVPGFNDTSENLSRTAEFVRSAGLSEINILPFHRLGSTKYRQLGMEYGFADVEPPSHKAMERYKEILEANGARCYVDFETPF